MAWQDLLEDTHEQQVKTLPWLGGRKVYQADRAWNIKGEHPRAHGWYEFKVRGRDAELLVPTERPMDFVDGLKTAKGYIVGNRFIAGTARVELDPTKLVDQTIEVFLVDRGLDRFSPALVAFHNRQGTNPIAIYVAQLYDTLVEVSVRQSFIDRKGIDDIRDVPPALDLAFRFAVWQRDVADQLRAEAERQRIAREKHDAALKLIGSGAGRRELAAVDFEAAAKAALLAGGAVYLDSHPAPAKGEMIVQYQVGARRLECICDRRALQIVSSGICLTDHTTHVSGDTWFTLESLPSVVREAIQAKRLVVWRHVEGDMPGDEDGDEDDW